VLNVEKPIATNRHLAIFAIICVLVAFSGVSAQLQGHAGSLDPEHANIIPTYVGTMLGEWLLLFFVWRGARASGVNLFDLAGTWKTPSGAVVDVLLGVAAAFALLYFDALVQHLLPASSAKSIDGLLPRGPIEIVLWIAVSITAGVVEELAFRGYLMRQLDARLHSLPFALIGQGLWFGAMHAYEGLNAVLSICAIGIALGLLAIWRRQLRTNMIAHTCMDLVSGLAPWLIWS
jgi:membrane protease YdiL (CAAX protease family)